MTKKQKSQVYIGTLLFFANFAGAPRTRKYDKIKKRWFELLDYHERTHFKYYHIKEDKLPLSMPVRYAG